MFIYLILFLLFPLNLYSFDLSVKTLYEGKALSFATVKVWQKASVIRSDNPDYIYKTNENGIAKISLDSGEYYVFAEKKVNDINLFGFYGQNPVSVRKNTEISLNLVKLSDNILIKKRESGVEGVVRHDGKPVGNVSVLVYLDLTSDLKGPAYLSTVTDEQGRFSLDISDGSYFFVFRKKNEELFGPPSPGDFVGIFPIFPLEVNGGGYLMQVSLLKIPEKMKSNLQQKSYIIKGQVLDKKKKPKKGVYVVLYEDYTLLGKPDYVSHPTDEKGNFRIYVKKPGTFFVVLRKSLGDTPQLGEDVSSFAEIEIGEKTVEKELVITTND